MAKFTAKPVLTVEVLITDDAGKTTTMELVENVILEDVTFKNAGKTLTKNGKVTKIMGRTKAVTPNYNECPCQLEADLLGAITIDGFVLDASDQYGADVYFIRVNELKAIGKVIEGTVTVDPATMEAGAVAAAIAALVPGQALELGEGKVEEALTFEAPIVVKGANAGVGAASGYRCQDVVEGETVISAPLVIAAGETELDGITLSGTAVPKLGKADSNEEVVIRMKNCRVTDLGDGSEAAQTINAFMAAGNNTNTVVRFEIENCYFGNNGGRMYNLFNMHGKWASGSYVKNCYFAKDCCVNTITIYDAEDNAVIDITGNTWESSKNGVRVLAKGAGKYEINIKNNVWHDTEAVQENGMNYGGLFMAQPNKPATITQKDIIVNMSGNVNMSQNPQNWYYWFDGDPEGKHTEIPVEDRPQIFVDGVLQEYNETNTQIEPIPEK